MPGDIGKTLKVRVTFSDDAGNEETLVSAATEAVAANMPDAPGNPTAATSAGREAELTVTWTAPASNGGAAITGYRVQWKSGSEDYDATASSTRQAAVTGLTHTIAGLTNGVSYTVRIVAVNDAGDGAGVEVSAEPRDRVVPVLSDGDGGPLHAHADLRRGAGRGFGAGCERVRGDGGGGRAHGGCGCGVGRARRC